MTACGIGELERCDLSTQKRTDSIQTLKVEGFKEPQMPGITGYISITRGLPELPDVTSRLTRSLMHEPSYTVQPIPCPDECVAVIVNPGIDGMICGAAREVGAGVSLGFYGEFYDPECQAAPGGDAVAEILLRRYRELDEGLPRSLDGSYVI